MGEGESLGALSVDVEGVFVGEEEVEECGRVSIVSRSSSSSG